MKREHWSSTLAFIFVAAGSAVGLGNVWRFSYIVGQNGGGAFLIPYTLSVILVGIPIMLLELGIGRYYGGGIISSLAKIKQYRWLKYLGYVPVIIVFCILSYYAVIMGWTLAYTVFSLIGIEIIFTQFSAGYLPLLFLFIVIIIIMFILQKGIKNGIEKTCIVLMPLLFIFLFLLILKSVTLPNAMDGIKYFLTPDLSVLFNLNIWLIAIGQTLFSLSAGAAILITYGSYMSRKEEIVGSTVIVALTDTIFALMAGFAIFPMISSFNLDSTAGPELAFITLPKVFALLPFGNLFATLFFLILFFGALTSAISLLEVVITAISDEFGYSRNKLILSFGALTFLLGIPSALSYTSLAIYIFEMRFLDFMDTLFGTILLPVSALIIIIGFVWFNHKDKILAEINKGTSFKIGKYMFSLWKYVIPVVLIVLLVDLIVSIF
ncbi:sodium-dependent transporter [Candidatus Woesearchaeota archaeon]|nr:sodium-dependent transporter [Candidatus Woesearchaeota archaeon]